MWQRLKIKAKIPLGIIGFALLVGSGIGFASYWTAREKIEVMTRERFMAILGDRKTELQSYFQNIEEDLRLFSKNPVTVEALKAMRDAFHTIPGDPSITLKQGYIEDNPHPLGQKHLLDQGSTGTEYDVLHARYHPWFREILTIRGYYDVFLFDNTGNLVYSVFKEEDFSTNFNEKSGPYAGTDLGEVYREAVAAPANTVAFRDFSAYAPSKGAPASFIAMPVVENGENIGVLAFQMPVGRLNAIMSISEGLGQTGETLIVGADGLLRNDSRFSEENDILVTHLDNAAVRSALGGAVTETFSSAYRNVELFEIAIPFTFQNTHWALVVAEESTEILEPLIAMRNSMLLAALGLFSLAGFGGWLIARTLTRPIGSIVTSMDALAKGVTDLALVEGARGDEIGDMMRALLVFRDNALERIKLEHAAQLEREREIRRQKNLDGLVRAFRLSIAGVLKALGAETSTMREAAGNLSTLAQGASNEVLSAKDAASDASKSVQSVAAAVEELSVSIQEIAKQAQQASDYVIETTEVARRTDAGVAGLSEAAERIGAVVGLIRAIAEKTNLLALNATIEAARAGEMGRGFAVVAEEVKTLAGQTAKATEEISTQIGAIQSATQQAVKAIGRISGTVGKIEEFTTAIATAVEEQGVATESISQSVVLAAKGSNQLEQNVTELSGAIDQTNDEAGQVHSIAETLGKVARELSEAVETFLVNVAQDVEERRRSTRSLADQVLVIMTNNNRTLTRVRDISETGIKTDAIPNVHAGDRIKLEWDDGHRVEAKVAWVTHSAAGIEFNFTSGREPALAA